MAELWIDQFGEVRLGCEVIGVITWANPCAHLDATGQWDREGGSYCWECGGVGVGEDDFNEIEAERDQLQEEVQKLKAELSRLKSAEVQS